MVVFYNRITLTGTWCIRTYSVAGPCAISVMRGKPWAASECFWLVPGTLED